MNRRRFLQSASAIAATSLSLTGSLVAQSTSDSKPQKAILKLSSQESRIPGKNLAEKVAKLEKWGGVGVEIGGNPTNRINEIKDALKTTNVKVSALCWGAASGALVSKDPDRRKDGINQMKSALDTAGELRSTGVIFVPAFNKDSDLPNKEIRKILLDILPEVGEHANKCQTRVLLEPLNRQEAFFLRQLADAAAICRDVNCPGVGMMGDFYHMYIEETSDCGAFLSAGKYLHHIHLASRKRNLPGQDERSFVDGFKGLKMIEYQDYCSLECSCVGDPEVEIPKSFRFLEEQWKQAKI